MPATITEAVDDMLGLLNTAWTTTVVPLGFVALVFDDNPEARPLVESGGDVPNWGKALVRHFDGFQPTLTSDTGKRRFRRTGAMTISIYARQDTGRRLLDPAAQAVINALQGKCTTNGVLFREVRLAEVGQDGVWFAANIIANFEYDQIT